MISSLNKIRGNASMAYINKRYIYIIGGFEIDYNLKGNYLNDMEFFDTHNFGKGWTIIKYVNNNKNYDISLTALGVLPISNNTFLICGGYDGKEYRTNVYKVDCCNQEHPTIEEISSLGYNVIFPHNMFCKIRNTYYNFDSFGRMFVFNYENLRFEILNQKENK